MVAVVRMLEPEDGAWEEVLQRLRHDAYHLPGYVTTDAERDVDSTVLAFHHTTVHGELFAPLVLRPVPAAPHLMDAASPYGYASPLFRGDAPEALDQSLGAYDAFCRQTGIIASFWRLHPLLDTTTRGLDHHCDVVTHGPTVWVDTTLDEDGRWAQMRPRLRTQLRGLRRAGYRTTVDDWERLSDAVALYRDTMRRVDAPGSYFFDDRYFASLQSRLERSLHLVAVVGPDGDTAAAGLFTSAEGLMQYHVGGTASDHLVAGASRLLFTAAASWAHDHGVNALHLGGGVGGREDNLFRFKAGFSRERAWYRTARMVHDATAYHGALPARVPDGHFFPAYRAPAGN